MVAMLCNPIDCGPPGSCPGKNSGVGIHSLLQGIFPPRDQTQVSCIVGRLFSPSPEPSRNVHSPHLVSQRNWLRGLQFSSVLSLSHVQLFKNLWTAARQTSLSITNSWSLLKFMSRELVMPSSHLILCHPLLLLPSIFSSIRVFSNESVLRIRWPKYWSFSFSIKTEYSGPISFRMDWFDLLAVQGTLKSLLQHHSSKASILWCSAFFIVQLSHPYMTTVKP